MKKEKIERYTLWVLAVGMLLAVSFKVAESVVHDYHDLQREIHQPQATQADNHGAGQ
jgi:hypothetical protein